MSSSISFLNLGLFSALSGQGLFGGSGAAVGDCSPNAGGMEAQYSLALEVALGQGSVAPGLAEGRIGHPLFSIKEERSPFTVRPEPVKGRHPAHTSRPWGMVPTHLLSGSSSPWMEGARLAVGEDGKEMVVGSGGWRMAGGGSAARGSGRTPKSKAKEPLSEAALLVKKLGRESLKTLSESLQSLGKIARELGDAERKQIAEMMVRQLGEKFPGISWDIGDLSVSPPPGGFKVSLPVKTGQIAGQFGKRVAEALRNLDALLKKGNTGPIQQPEEEIPAVEAELVQRVVTGLEVEDGNFALGAVEAAGAEKGVVPGSGPTGQEGTAPPSPPADSERPAKPVTSDSLKWIKKKISSGEDVWAWQKEFLKRLGELSDEEKNHAANFAAKELKESVNPVVRHAAVCALGAIVPGLGDDKLKGALAGQIAGKLGDDNSSVRFAAVWALRDIVPGLEDEGVRLGFAEQIAEKLGETEGSVSDATIWVLEEIGETLGPESLEALIGKIGEDYKDVGNSDVQKILGFLGKRLEELKPAAASTATLGEAKEPTAGQGGTAPPSPPTPEGTVRSPLLTRRQILVGGAAALIGGGSLLGSGVILVRALVAGRMLRKIEEEMRDGESMDRVQAIVDLRNKFTSLPEKGRFLLAEKVLEMLKDEDEKVRHAAAWFFSQGPEGGVGGYLTETNAKKLIQSLEVNHPHPEEAEKARRWLEKLLPDPLNIRASE